MNPEIQDEIQDVNAWKPL